ncbi:MAG TPA: N,N-dimethylformamidase beta subunit family domain-containing protein [Miltoncostaeaceae bacterium]|nr:N,N-dimethylformamidase beta subunit family domain-containing protein [Miltoncostaeaceae bacterium]
MRLTRRQLLAAGAAGAVVVPAGLYGARHALRDGGVADPAPKGEFPAPDRPRDCARPANPTVAENCRPGSTAWRLTRADGGIEGFFDETSVPRGAEAVLRLRTADPEYRVEVYRTGYYGDTGARLVARTPARRAGAQPEPRADRRRGLVSASNWRVSERFDTADWPSGVYLAKLIGSSGSDDHAILVVREDDRPSDVLYLLSDTTYLAYNYWGGYSLYAGGDDDPRGVSVSWDRPYGNSRFGQADWYLRAEHALVRWLEAEGYDVAYAGAFDVHRHGVAGLGRRGAWISGGHNEYWSGAMRDAHERAVGQGVHLAVMAANTAYWRVRFEPDPWTGRADRVMTCFKDGEVSATTLGPGPVRDPREPTGLWRDPEGADRPENALLGVMYVGQDLRRYYPLQVPADAAADPLWARTGLAPGGARIGRELVGWEWDAVVDNGRTPAGLRVLAATPVSGQLMGPTGRPGEGDAVAHTTAYRAPGGALVFATGSILLSWGLDREGRRRYDPGRPQGEPDTRVQGLMRNVLGSMGARPGSPARDVRPPPAGARPGVT